MRGDPDLELRRLVLTEEHQRNALREAMSGSEVGFRPALLAWWASVEAVLAAMEKMGLADCPPSFLPVTILAILREQVGYLARGILPLSMRDVTSSGHPRPGPREEHHIGFATAYVRLARVGIIKDRRFNQTVQAAFKVGPSTVQNWAKLDVPAQVMRFYDKPDLLKRRMLEAGRNYAANAKRDGGAR